MKYTIIALFILLGCSSVPEKEMELEPELEQNSENKPVSFSNQSSIVEDTEGDTLFLNFVEGMNWDQYNKEFEKLEISETVKNGEYQFIVRNKSIPLELKPLIGNLGLNTISLHSDFKNFSSISSILHTYKSKYDFNTITLTDDLTTGLLQVRVESAKHYAKGGCEKCKQDKEKCEIFQRRYKKEKIVEKIMEDQNLQLSDPILSGKKQTKYYINDNRRLILKITQHDNSLFPKDSFNEIEIFYLGQLAFDSMLDEIKMAKQKFEKKQSENNMHKESVEDRKSNFINEI